MASLTVETKKKRYIVSLAVQPLNHLCTFKEVTDFKLTTQEYSNRFNDFRECTDALEEDELKLVSSMFSKLITESNNLGGDNHGVILSMNTGNCSRWDYTLLQKKNFLPVFEHITFDSSMVLYNKRADYTYTESGYTSDQPKVSELTMFNFSGTNLRSVAGNFETYKQELITKHKPEGEDEEVVEASGLTEQMIRDYLQQGT